MIIILVISLASITLYSSRLFFKDLINSDKDLEKDVHVLPTSIIGFIAYFFDTLGIGSFAPLTTLLRAFKQTKDKLIPGTLNVSAMIPVMIEAFVFITIIEVQSLTLIAMVFAATIGSIAGASIISKFSEKTIQLVIGLALISTATLMFLGQIEWIKGLGVGKDIGLTGIKLLIASTINFALGACQAAGIGMYAPSMALVYFLGLSPQVAYPIMMASSAFALPSASIEYIKKGAYNKKASIYITISGILGVLIAAFIVRSLNLYHLTWIVIFIIVYTGVTLLYKVFRS
tara:strand:- start:7205 stop:8068 length:864 start_codon:yes stop_codon:yes gene_type:complete